MTGSSPVLRILCVEDSPSDFHLVGQHLRDSGAPAYELHQATSVRSAVEILSAPSETGFDIVLLDLTLPDSEGTTSLSAIQQADPSIAVTVLTGLDEKGLGIRLIKAGAQDFLPKSELRPELLLRTITHAVERKRSQGELRSVNSKLASANQRLSDAEKHLIQSEKLESLGRLAAGVAHEVKNPLAILQMGVDFFQRRSDAEDKTALAMLSSMKDAIERANTIVLGMVDLSRPAETEFANEDINELVRKALEMVRHEFISNNVTLQVELLENLPIVAVDRNRIEQVLINLAINAAHAMGELDGHAGTLRVRTMLGEVQHSPHEEGSRHFDRLRQRDEIVVVEFRDSGPGIPPDKIHQVYEPFFTTKPTGKGTGLGLSVVKGIMQQHKGSIHMENVENPRGLRVRLIFKVTSQDHLAKVT
ncbi:MAG: ATP-binding protein [Verrucomicrobiota bacterium]